MHTCSWPQIDDQQQNTERCEECEVQPAPPTNPGGVTTSMPAIAPAINDLPSDIKLPRVAITFCTQCKWMLRAAYFGQELLSTFGSAIGEIALIPATGGLFQVNVTHRAAATQGDESAGSVEEVLLWDRKSRGGFPETKVLKQLVRDVIEPEKGLGHSDAPGKGKGRVKETKVGGGGQGGKDAEELAVESKVSGPVSLGAKSTLAERPLLVNADGKDDESRRKGSTLRISPPITTPVPIDPLLEDANATPLMAGSTQQHSIDPLLQTAIASPTVEARVPEALPEAETREDPQSLGSPITDAYTTVKAPLTWQDEGIRP